MSVEPKILNQKEFDNCSGMEGTEGVIQPLSKALYEELKKNKIVKFQIKFDGGNDEGQVEIILYKTYKNHNGSFRDKPVSDTYLENQVDVWVWKAYEYSGAGDGNAYGNIYTYNLVENIAFHESWYTVSTIENESSTATPFTLYEEEKE